MLTNPGKHSRHQIRQIAASIKAFGFTNPVLINQNDIIIAGHGRVAAAKLLNLDQVPTIRLDSLSEDQVRAYVLPTIASRRKRDGTNRSLRLNCNTY